MKFVGAHRPLEFLRVNALADERVRIEQHPIIKQDVVDPDNLFAAQFDIVDERRALIELHIEAEMDVVVEIRPGGDDPVDKPGFDQRDQAGFSQTGRHQRAGEADADCAVARAAFFR